VDEEENPMAWGGVKGKLISITTAVYGKACYKQICEVVRNLDNYNVSRLIDLVQGEFIYTSSEQFHFQPFLITLQSVNSALTKASSTE